MDSVFCPSLRFKVSTNDPQDAHQIHIRICSVLTSDFRSYLSQRSHLRKAAFRTVYLRAAILDASSSTHKHSLQSICGFIINSGPYCLIAQGMTKDHWSRLPGTLLCGIPSAGHSTRRMNKYPTLNWSESGFFLNCNELSLLSFIVTFPLGAMSSVLAESMPKQPTLKFLPLSEMHCKSLGQPVCLHK